jgi:hypothetical protein
MGAGPVLLDVIVKTLAPYIGENMARASVRGQCDKLHLIPSAIRPEQVTTIVDALAPGLNVFVGRDKTAQIVDAIRRAIIVGGHE